MGHPAGAERPRRSGYLLAAVVGWRFGQAALLGVSHHHAAAPFRGRAPYERGGSAPRRSDSPRASTANERAGAVDRKHSAEWRPCCDEMIGIRRRSTTVAADRAPPRNGYGAGRVSVRAICRRDCTRDEPAAVRYFTAHDPGVADVFVAAAIRHGRERCGGDSSTAPRRPQRMAENVVPRWRARADHRARHRDWPARPNREEPHPGRIADRLDSGEQRWKLVEDRQAACRRRDCKQLALKIPRRIHASSCAALRANLSERRR
jgi:hypothetical protein